MTGYPPMVRWFGWYFRRLARRHFAGVHWSVEEDPSAWGPTPIIAVANHSTWWDGPLAYLLTGGLGREFHVAMEATHLARYPYFRGIGAHPLRRTTPRQRWEDLERIGSVLSPGAMLWMFPQGARRPSREPLVHLERGAAHLALAHGPVRILPVGIRLAHFSEQLPEAFLQVGRSWLVGAPDMRDRRAVTAEIERALVQTLARADERIATERLDAWRPLLGQGTLSLNKRLDRLGHLVGLFEGGFEPRNG